MLRRLLDWVAARLGHQKDDEEPSETHRFVPSVLDASVRYAHGESASAGEREIADLEAEGRNLEAERRER